MTRNQSEWLQQNRRLRALQRRMERDGYIFEENIYHEAMPNRITREDIEELQEINKRELVQSPKVSYVNKDTGEITQGNVFEPISAPKKKKQKKEPIIHLGESEEEPETLDNSGEIVYDRFLNELNKMEADLIRIPLVDLLERLKDKYDANTVGKKLEETADFFKDFLGLKQYSSGDAVEEWSSLFIEKFPFDNKKEKAKYVKLVNDFVSTNFNVE